MKFKITFVVLFLLLPVISMTQTIEPDYSKLFSRVTPPANLNPTPLGTSSIITTSADGYDNIYLGTDFGELHVAINPTDPLNAATAYNINT